MRVRIVDAVEPVVCPTITARDAQEYRLQMKRLAGFVKRVHIDITDGVFSHVALAPIKDIWWPDDVETDIHVMYKDPLSHIKELLALKPRLLIVHAEAEGNFLEFAKLARENDIAVGVALRPHTPVTDIEAALAEIDHVLILSGYLGNLGGYANTHLLTKVLRLKQLRPALEIGWEGGITDMNIATLAAGGVDVFNAGDFIKHAGNAHAAHEKLEYALQSLPSKHKQL